MPDHVEVTPLAESILVHTRHKNLMQLAESAHRSGHMRDSQSMAVNIVTHQRESGSKQLLAPHAHGFLTLTHWQSTVSTVLPPVLLVVCICMLVRKHSTTATDGMPHHNHLPCGAAEGMQDLLSVKSEVAGTLHQQVTAAVDPAVLYDCAAKQPGQGHTGTQLMRAAGNRCSHLSSAANDSRSSAADNSRKLLLASLGDGCLMEGQMQRMLG